MTDIRTRVLARMKALENERHYFEKTAKDVTTYMAPRRGFFESLGHKPNKSPENDDRIEKNTAGRALKLLASGMHSGLTPPTRPWFRLKFKDEGLNDQDEAKGYLWAVEQRVYESLRESNFYPAMHTTYYELAAFGTQALMIMEKPGGGVTYKVLTFGEYLLGLDDQGDIDTIYRTCWMSAKQMRERFGFERLSTHVQNALKNNRLDDWFEVIHAVQPRGLWWENLKGRRDGKAKAFESVYMEKAASQTILSEGGFDEFPCAASRWEVVGSDTYGSSPAFDVLPDVRMLQEMEAAGLNQIQKAGDPPMRAPTTLMDEKIYTFPGGLNYTDSDGLKPLYEVRADTASVQAKIKDVELGIREGLYNDLFRMIAEQPDITATAVIELQQEKMTMLGPVIERQLSELLSPAIERTVAILDRQGELPMPPESLEGEELDIEFISMFAMAQKRMVLEPIKQVAAYVASLAAVYPECVDVFDVDKSIEEFAAAVGAPPTLIRQDDARNQIRAQRAEQQQAQQAMMEAGSAVASAKTLSEIPTEEPNALADLLGGAQ